MPGVLRLTWTPLASSRRLFVAVSRDAGRRRADFTRRRGREISARRRRALPRQGRHLRHVRARRRRAISSRSAQQVAEDFRLMAGLGINTVRTYTPPRRDLLDEAARHGLRVMVGLPWSQHVAFLDDRAADAKRSGARSSARVRELGDHPAVLTFALGNEIPPGVVRWHGRVRVERFPARALPGREGRGARDACSPTSTFRRPSFSISRSSTSARSTSTCTAKPSCARTWRGCSTSPATSRCCWPRPAPTASAKARRARPTITAMHIRAAFEEGACGAIAFAWTDEWWRGGHPVDDWAFGLVDRERRPKPAALAVAAAFERRAVLAGARSRPGRASRSSSAPTTPPTRSRTACRRSTG